MRVKLKVSSTAIIEAGSDKHEMVDIFEELAKMQEVFAHEECGCCKSKDIRFLTRTVDKNKFYEMRCNKCFARLQFGCSQENKGDLYPKRRWDSLSPSEKTQRADEQKTMSSAGYLANNGWYKYVKKE